MNEVEDACIHIYISIINFILDQVDLMSSTLKELLE